MTHKPLTSGAAILLTLFPVLLASAQSASSYVFETVDSYELEATSRAKITGIIQGEATPRTIPVYTSTDSELQQRHRSCERMALLAMNKPGQYYLEVKNSTTFTLTCKLTRR